MIGRGPQVLLDGAAALAARGGAGRTMRENIAAKQALEAAGVVSDGNSVDGRSITGVEPEDIFLGGPQSITLPIGTTAERPSTGNVGEMRFNSTTSNYEFGFGGSWANILTDATALSKVTTDPQTVAGPVAFNGEITGTAVGTDVNDLLKLVSSGGAGFPMVNPSTRMVFRRAGTPSATDTTDFQFDRNAQYTGGDSLAPNRVIGVNFTVGPNAGAGEHGIIITGLIQNTAQALHPSHYGLWAQMTRDVGAKGHVTGMIANIVDNTGLPSSSAGANLLGYEADVYATGVDDGTNASSWGGFGVRRLISVIAGQTNANTVDTQFGAGIFIGTTADDLVSISSGIGFGVGSRILSALDTRGLDAPTGVTDPVAAVRMEASQIIDFNGGATLRAAPGNYLQYRTATGRLYYVVGGVDKFSIDASGNVRAAGTLTGSTTP